jgi:hypothetical protein
MVISALNARAPAVMRNLDESGNLQFETAIRIPAGTRVDVCQDGYCASGDAMYCRECGGVFLVGIRLRRERRLEPRVEASGSAMLAEVGTADTTEANADIRHISLSGMGLVTNRAFEPPAFVRVETSTWFVFGEVRHCTRADKGRYALGIIFLTESFNRPA